jgi:hypothetical protein
VKAGSFGGSFVLATSDQIGLLEYAIDAGRTDRDHIGIEHHVSQSAVAFERIVKMELDDRLFLGFGQPMVTRNPAIMLVDFAVAVFPSEELAGLDADPSQNGFAGDTGFVFPAPNVIDDLVSYFVRNPATV